MQYLAQALFVAIVGAAVWLFSRKIGNIRRVILMGKDETIETDRNKRMSNLVLLALGQKKMFKNPLVAIMHFVLYVGFIIINIEVLEIVLDGILGTHRLFAPMLGSFYSFLINAFEILAFAVLVFCIVFLVRRNVLKLRRFMSNDLNGWPRSDANYILITEIVLMSLFLLMNATEGVLIANNVSPYAEHAVGPFVISQHISPLLSGLSNTALAGIERTAWWLHIIGILAFLNYLPYSKHLHILFAFPNAWFARPESYGKMHNMPEIQKEVALAMGQDISTNPVLSQLPDAPPNQFGAKDIFDLGWKNLLDAYSCTECGRCSAACPANSTGKVLSPRAIMMKTRDRAEAVSKVLAANNGQWVDDGKSLLHDYITVEELRACTTCNACVEECPVSISPLDIILKQRRYLILDESNSPGEWNAMFGNIENNFAPWKFNPEEREAWVNG
ncbi:(Fe-S)-binding protein [Phnomibacter ginsenosidimutans]|uniref:4Fe-4S dicluster domain-containing protein n=1 Tax=Phnomibacter ginsenosidimutans TaxID=2676868 RepID=A0A6I6H1V0_9BACT|nr:(Fe-S)-binding protein [Phnomibacter ginsenosidimutans]QGW28601.1 4Fe-4S dicluster domain-containing protein [Phnomibacter ginsenosidimutans]